MIEDRIRKHYLAGPPYFDRSINLSIMAIVCRRCAPTAICCLAIAWILVACGGNNPPATAAPPTPNIQATVEAAVQLAIAAIPSPTSIPTSTPPPLPTPIPTQTPVVVESTVSSLEAVARFRTYLEENARDQLLAYLNFVTLNQQAGCVAYARELSGNEVFCDSFVISIADVMSTNVGDMLSQAISNDIEAEYQGAGAWTMVVHITDGRDLEDQHWYWFENEEVEPQLIG